MACVDSLRGAEHLQLAAGECRAATSSPAACAARCESRTRRVEIAEHERDLGKGRQLPVGIAIGGRTRVSTMSRARSREHLGCGRRHLRARAASRR